jgi:hypothetical protein
MVGVPSGTYGSVPVDCRPLNTVDPEVIGTVEVVGLNGDAPWAGNPAKYD